MDADITLLLMYDVLKEECLKAECPCCRTLIARLAGAIESQMDAAAEKVHEQVSARRRMDRG